MVIALQDITLEFHKFKEYMTRCVDDLLSRIAVLEAIPSIKGGVSIVRLTGGDQFGGDQFVGSGVHLFNMLNDERTSSNGTSTQRDFHAVVAQVGPVPNGVDIFTALMRTYAPAVLPNVLSLTDAKCVLRELASFRSAYSTNESEKDQDFKSFRTRRSSEVADLVFLINTKRAELLSVNPDQSRLTIPPLDLWDLELRHNALVIAGIASLKLKHVTGIVNKFNMALVMHALQLAEEVLVIVSSFLLYLLTACCIIRRRQPVLKSKRLLRLRRYLRQR